MHSTIYFLPITKSGWIKVNEMWHCRCLTTGKQSRLPRTMMELTCVIKYSPVPALHIARHRTHGLQFQGNDSILAELVLMPMR